MTLRALEFDISRIDNIVIALPNIFLPNIIQFTVLLNKSIDELTSRYTITLFRTPCLHL